MPNNQAISVATSRGCVVLTLWKGRASDSDADAFRRLTPEEADGLARSLNREADRAREQTRRGSSRAAPRST